MCNAVPFGLKPIPSIFQRLMKTLLNGLPFVIVFVDDVIIFSKSFEEHTEHVRLVLERINRANLKLNLEKSFFGFSTLDVLGHEVHPKGSLISYEKILTAFDLPRPTTLKQIQAFLGFFNYLRDRIPRFAEITRPLIELEASPGKWNESCEEAYFKLRESVVSNVMLSCV